MGILVARAGSGHEIGPFTEDRFLILDREGKADTVARIKGERFWGTSRASVRLRDGVRAHFAAAGGTLAGADGAEYVVTLFDTSGHVRSRLRNMVPPPPILPDTSMPILPPRGLEPGAVTQLNPPDPTHGAAIKDLVLSNVEDLWVLREDDENGGSWHVYSADLIFRMVVRTPPRLKIMAVSGSVVTGIWTDSLNVPYVRRYEIRANPVIE